MKHILMVGGWKENYEAALSLGYTVTGLAASNQRGLLSNDVLQQCEFIDADSSDVPLALWHAQLLHKRKPIHGVFSFTERGLETAAVIGMSLGIPGNELGPNVLTRNKHLTRQQLVGTSLDNVAWTVGYRAEDLLSFFDIHGKCVLKPINGVGSEGVAVISDRLVLANEALGRRFPLLVEAYVDGAEYSVETISLGGKHQLLAITQKTLTENLVEMQHLMPAPISSEERDALERSVDLLLSALGVENSVAHSEFRLRRDDAGTLHVHLIETQLRPGGGRIWKLLDICRGINVFRVLMENVVEGKATHPVLSIEKPCLAYFPRFPNGVVTRIDGLGELGTSPGVEFVDLDISVGKPTQAYVSSATRNGSVIVSAPSFEELLSRRDVAMANLHVTVGEAQ